MFIPHTAGSGKHTLLSCMGHELGKNVKIIHSTDLMSGGGAGGHNGGGVADSISYLENLLKDARLVVDH